MSNTLTSLPKEHNDAPHERPADGSLDPMNGLSQALAQHRESDLKLLQEMAARRNEVLFDGQWRSAEDARRCHRGMRWRSWLRVLEILVVLAGLLVVAGLVVFVLAIVGGVNLGAS